jgi:hypothetical protein
MSRLYIIAAILNTPHNEKNIAHIFQRGLDLGFIIYDKYDQDEDIYFKALDSNQAASTLLKLLEAPENDLWNAFLTVKFEDIEFSIRITPNDSNTRVSIVLPSFPVWQRYLGDDDTIDFARYIRFLLALCKDFSILELKTFAG